MSMPTFVPFCMLTILGVEDDTNCFFHIVHSYGVQEILVQKAKPQTLSKVNFTIYDIFMLVIGFLHLLLVTE